MTENIEVFTQNSILIRNQDKVIYLDPFKMRGEPKNADYILITHDHYDHFSPEDIEKVSNGDSVLIVPEKMADKAHKVYGTVGKICTVNPGTHYGSIVGSFDDEMVFAEHIKDPIKVEMKMQYRD